MIFLGIIGLLFIFFAPQIIWFYTDDPNVVPYGVDCLRIVAYGFLFYAYGLVITHSFNGAGDTCTPTIIYIFVVCILELPPAYVLTIVMGIGTLTVYITIILDLSAHIL